MSSHVMCQEMSWCKACGRPYWEIVDENLTHCEGDPLKIHPRYWAAQERAAAIFGPAVDRLVNEIPLPGERKS